MPANLESTRTCSFAEDCIMKTMLLLIITAVVSSSAVMAQAKVVHFKKLQECLPTKELTGLKRNKPTGTTQTSMGMSTSEAAVRYATEATEDTTPVQSRSIEIKIADMVMIPYALMAFGYQQDYENESEEGYQKSVLVLKKYKGMEEGKTGDSKSSKISFGVANRYIVTIDTYGFPDNKILYTLVDAMDLDKLEKLN